MSESYRTAATIELQDINIMATNELHDIVILRNETAARELL